MAPIYRRQQLRGAAASLQVCKLLDPMGYHNEIVNVNYILMLRAHDVHAGRDCVSL